MVDMKFQPHSVTRFGPVNPAITLMNHHATIEIVLPTVTSEEIEPIVEPLGEPIVEAIPDEIPEQPIASHSVIDVLEVVNHSLNMPVIKRPRTPVFEFSDVYTSSDEKKEEPIENPLNKPVIKKTKSMRLVVEQLLLNKRKRDDGWEV
jgi:hypothetical protein